MCRKSLWVVMLLCLGVGNLPSSEYGLVRIAELMGVTPEALESFYHSVNEGSLSGAHTVTTLPELPIAHNKEDRSRWLLTLAESGLSVLAEPLSLQLLAARLDWMSTQTVDEKIEQTILLYDWIDDLVRAHRRVQALPAAWLKNGEGFLSIKGHSDFPFEDADVLLVLGGSSVSSLITQATFPRGRFSHAMILNHQEEGLVTLETLIETGSISRSTAVFSDLNLQAVLVLRWKDTDTTRSMLVTTEAVNKARRLVELQLPYDMRMDMNDTQRMFCSEFVATAFAYAADLPVGQLIPFHSRVRSPAVSDYLANFGVHNNEMISPGDLLRSGRFEVVAEFRKADDLEHFWRMLLNTEIMLSRMEQGYAFQPSALSWLKSSLGVKVDTLGTPLRMTGKVGFRMVPESLNRRALATMLTQEHILFGRPQSTLGRETGLLTTPPWYWFSQLEQAMDEDFRVKHSLRPPPQSGAIMRRYQRR